MASEIATKLAQGAIFALAYGVAASAGLQWATIRGASPIWPASGIAMAGLVLGGPQLWPSIFVGRLAAGFLSDGTEPLWLEVAMAVGNVLSALLSYHILVLWSRTDLRLTSMRDVLWLALAAAAGALLFASIKTAILHFALGLEAARCILLWEDLLFAYFVGGMTVAPLILAWSDYFRRGYSRTDWLHFAALLAAAIAISGLMLVDSSPLAIRLWYIFPVLIWGALSFQVRGAAVILLIVWIVLIWGATTGAGQFAMFPDHRSRLFEAQQFAAIGSFTIVLLAAIADERRGKEALIQSERRLKLVLDAGHHAIWDWNLTAGNARYLGQWASKEGIIPVGDGSDFATWANLIHPDDRDRVIASLEKHIRQEPQLYKAEFRLKSREGGWRWILARGLIVETDSRQQPVRVLGTQTDVTELRRREEQVQVLLREVNHRTKNILGLVQSVAVKTIASGPEDFLKRFLDRLQALSRSQDLLIRCEWRGAYLDDLILSQLEHFKDETGRRITLAGPKLKVSTSAAQTLGLAVHELATNASKHGSLTSPTGKVHIFWSLDSELNNFTLEWRERGGPPASQPARRGFGSLVTGRIAEIGLDAQVETNFGELGFTWRLSCPAERLRSGYERTADTSS